MLYLVELVSFFLYMRPLWQQIHQIIYEGKEFRNDLFLSFSSRGIIRKTCFSSLVLELIAFHILSTVQYHTITCSAVI